MTLYFLSFGSHSKNSGLLGKTKHNYLVVYHYLLMNKTAATGKKCYYGMATRETENGAIYDEVMESGEQLLTFERQRDEKKRRVSREPSHSSSKSEAVIVQRLLCMISAVIIFSVLTSASTLVLALTIMMSRNSLAANYHTVRGRFNQAFSSLYHT